MKKLWPSRTQSKPSEVIADLDALIADPVSFKMHGKTHTIKPVTTKEFMQFTNAYALFWEMKDKETVTPDELIDRYFDLISPICDSVKREDIANLTQAQVGALFNLVIEVVTAKAHVDTAQKKTSLSQTRIGTLDH